MTPEANESVSDVHSAYQKHDLWWCSECRKITKAGGEEGCLHAKKSMGTIWKN